MITFDDGRESQYLLAAPVLEQWQMKGVFFIMTIALNKSGYLKAHQLKDFFNRGHFHGLHSVDHPNFKKLRSLPIQQQIILPRKQLESITGKKLPVSLIRTVPGMSGW